MKTRETSPLPSGRLDKFTDVPIRVLCVDDETSFLISTKQILELKGAFHVETVSSVNKALQKVGSETFDVIVSDYQMPEKDGLDLLKELRENGNYIPFILFTGKGREEVAVKALNLGADRYFNKFGRPETVYGELVHGIRQATAQKRVEQKIWDKEERLRAIFSSSPDAMFVTDLNGEVTDCSLETLKLLNFSSKKDLIGKNTFSFLAKRDHHTVRLAVETLFKYGFMNNLECSLLTKNGSEIPVEFSASIIRDALGSPVGAVGIARNITYRKKAEATLRQSESKFRSFFENSPDYCYIISPESKLLEINKSALEALGYAKEELIGKSLLATVYAPSSRRKAKKLFENWKHVGKIRNQELDIITKRGEKRTVLLSAHSVKDVDGQLLYSVSVQKDITEHKKADEALRKSEEMYRNIVELSPDGIATMSMRGTITSVNRAFLELTGFSEDEIVGKHFTKLGTVRAKDIPKFAKLVAQFLGGKQLAPTEFVYIRKDGTECLGEAHITLLEEKGKKLGLQAILKDITEQKQADEALRHSEEKYRSIVELSPDGIISLDMNGIVTSVNRAILTQTGFSEKEFLGKHFTHLAAIPAENLSTLTKTIESFIRGNVPDVFEFVYCCKDGTQLLAEASVGLLNKNGKPSGIQMIFRDITERKKIEDALKESEEKFRTLAEQSPNMIFINQDRKIVYVNPKCEQLIGYTKEEFYSPEFDFLCLISDECVEQINSNFSKHMKGKDVPPYEYSLITKNGQRIEATLTTKLIIYNGKNAILGTVTDVTERKKTKDSLNKERETLEKVTGNLSTTLVIISKDFRILWANKFLKDVLGDVTGKICYSTLNRLDHVCSGCKVKEVIQTGNQAVHEQQIIHSDGQKLLFEITAIPIKDKNGHTTEVLELALDITERKNAEYALRESEEKFRTLAEQSPNMIFINQEGRTAYANRKCEEILGYSQEELLSPDFSHFTLLSPESVELMKSIVSKHEKGKEVSPFEYSLMTKDGKQIEAILATKLITYNGKKAILGTITDITDRKKAEDELKKTFLKLATLNEKLGVIGKLTRHDARNKLSTIINSAYLATEQLEKNHPALEHLRTIELSVDQVEKILEFSRHYEILGTEKLTAINVTKSLDEAFMLLSCSDKIEFVNNCDGLTVMADSLLRQLFYNLLENSLRHGEKVSKIKLYCKEKQDELKLVYEDDGLGIPADEKEKIFSEGHGKGTGYGLYLIKKICDAYGWTIRECGVLGKGAQFVMTIPKLSKDGKSGYILKKDSP